MVRQPDNKPEFQDFFNWENSDSTRRHGLRYLVPDNSSGTQEAGADTDPTYIPRSAVEKYLIDKKGTARLLKVLYPDGGYDAPNEAYVRKYYLRPLAILVSNDHGDFISNFTHHESLQDGKLPFRHRPPDFPRSPNDQVWTAFNKKQWMYCPVEFRPQMNETLHPHSILPISEKRPIGRGYTSRVFSFDPDPEYDRLTSSDVPLQGRNSPRTYVMKCLKGRGASKYYEKEMDAYKRLGLDKNTSSYFLHLYGGLRWQEHHILIFDFADMGSLAEYMETNKNPESGAEIRQLWLRILDVFEGLHRIHNIQPNEDGNQAMLGWHQDLKLDNILLRSRTDSLHSNEKSSLLNCDILITDFGLSHFRKRRGGNRNVRDSDTGGTYIYGAPETYRYEQRDERILQVEPKVDVWSLGGNLSEFATWTVAGWRRVEQYRIQRRKEAREKLGPTTGEIFHDGSRVLEAVKQSHDNIIESLKDGERNAAERFIQLIDKMLVPENDRPNTNRLRKDVEAFKNAAKISSKADIPDLDVTASTINTSVATSTGLTERRNDAVVLHTPQIPDSSKDSIRGIAPPISSPSNLRLPSEKWSFDDALRWKRSKSLFHRPELPHQAALSLLDSRRHILLVDNTATMFKNKDDLQKFVEVLTYVVKRFRADCIEMNFTKSPSKKLLESKKTTKFRKTVSTVPFHGNSNSDIASELYELFEEYIRYWMAAESQIGMKHFRQRKKRETIYVLTDGLWHSNIVKENIKKFVSKLQDKGVPHYSVGIQFIRFGDDPVAMRRLELLRRLSHENLTLDIINTTRWNGDLIQTLKGSLENISEADDENKDG